MTNVPLPISDSPQVLALEEIGKLAEDSSKPAETLSHVVALIARRFQTDVCSAYLLEPDRANLVLAATLGLRKQAVGTLRLSLHEGLTGLVAEQVRPVAVEPGAEPSALQILSPKRVKSVSLLPRRSADRSRRPARRAGGADDRRPRLSRRGNSHADGGRRAGRPDGQPGAHARRFIAPSQERLWALARNLWWSWDHDCISLFHDLDPVRWAELNQNPVALLSEMPLATIERRATRTACCTAASITLTAASRNICKRRAPGA